MKEDTGAPVVALVADLLFASKIRGAGGPVETATRADAVRERVERGAVRLVLVDLAVREDAVGLIRWVKESSEAEVVAFGPHTYAELLEAAREAGTDRVLARSAFVRELPGILRERKVEGGGAG